MIVNWVGNFQNGYVGELGDAVHLSRELEALGHTVRRIPQDEWREHVIDGKDYPNVPKDLKADINIICKWHHFYDEGFINRLRVDSGGSPVFYWVWDYMDDQGFPDWHIKAVEACDLYLSNDVRNPKYRGFAKQNMYYFPFDVADEDISRFQVDKEYDLTFFGSCIGQGDRIEWMTEINKTNPIKVFSWNWQEWEKRGFDAEPAVYGTDFNRKVARSKIILGFSVEPSCWGYWSNRVGKVLLARGFLLYQYAPGMELFLRDGVEYFSSIDEAREKIDYYLIADTEREEIARTGWMIAQDRFSSKARIKDLTILMERYLKDHGNWKY